MSISNFGKNMKHFLLALSFSLCLLLNSCSSKTGQEPEQETYIAMGTIFQQRIYGADESVNKGLRTVTEELENIYLSHRLTTSEIYHINEKGEGQLSEKLKKILEQCIYFSEQSEGAFDITLLEVARLWDIDSRAKTMVAAEELPTAEEISQTLKNTGMDRLRLENNRILLQENTQIDLGAVGKGVALDEMYAILKEAKQNEALQGGIILAGGSVLTVGDKPDGAPWRVAVVNPLNTEQHLGYLELQGDWFVSSSGDYERYFEIENKRYHHILDPMTGYPADSGLSGVTILCGEGWLSDALSTSCFVLGREKGEQLLSKYDAYGIFVDKEGTIVLTDGMEQFFVQ